MHVFAALEPMVEILEATWRDVGSCVVAQLIRSSQYAETWQLAFLEPTMSEMIMIIFGRHRTFLGWCKAMSPLFAAG